MTTTTTTTTTTTGLELHHPYGLEVVSLLRRLAAHRFTPVAIMDGCDQFSVASRKEAVEAILSVDNCSLYVVHPSLVHASGEPRRQGLFIVMGNSPGELVCDHSDVDLLTAVVDEHHDHWCSVD